MLKGRYLIITTATKVPLVINYYHSLINVCSLSHFTETICQPHPQSPLTSLPPSVALLPTDQSNPDINSFDASTTPIDSLFPSNNFNFRILTLLLYYTAIVPPQQQ